MNFLYITIGTCTEKHKDVIHFLRWGFIGPSTTRPKEGHAARLRSFSRYSRYAATKVAWLHVSGETESGSLVSGTGGYDNTVRCRPGRFSSLYTWFRSMSSTGGGERKTCRSR